MTYRKQTVKQRGFTLLNLLEYSISIACSTERPGSLNLETLRDPSASDHLGIEMKKLISTCPSLLIHSEVQLLRIDRGYYCMRNVDEDMTRAGSFRD